MLNEEQARARAEYICVGASAYAPAVAAELLAVQKQAVEACAEALSTRADGIERNAEKYHRRGEYNDYEALIGEASIIQQDIDALRNLIKEGSDKG